LFELFENVGYRQQSLVGFC